MATSKRAKIYYGWQITSSNRYIDFNDGAGVKLATLSIGSYNSQELANEIVKQMNAVSLVDFTCTFNRSTRKFTISSVSAFSLLFLTGVTFSQSVASLLGYTVTDKTAALTYTSENASGYEYKTQFIPQSFKNTTTNRKSIEGTINKSSSGVIEVIKFGNERFLEFELLFITNVIQNDVSIIRTNITGVEDYLQFIEYATEKNTLEIMLDESNPSDFRSFLLESTESDSKGLDYELIELYDRGLPEYFRSGKLTFRLLE